MSQNRMTDEEKIEFEKFASEYDFALNELNYKNFKEGAKYATYYADAIVNLKLSRDEAPFYSFAKVALQYEQEEAKQYASAFIQAKEEAIKKFPQLTHSEANMFAYGRLRSKGWSDDKVFHYSKAKVNYHFDDNQAEKYANIRIENKCSEIEARYKASPSYSVWLQKNAQLLMVATLVVPPVAIVLLIVGALSVNKEAKLANQSIFNSTNDNKNKTDHSINNDPSEKSSKHGR